MRLKFGHLVVVAVIVGSLFYIFAGKPLVSPYASGVLMPGKGLLDLQIGKSSYSDVVALLGEPDSVKKGSSTSTHSSDQDRVHRQWLGLHYHDLGLVITLDASDKEAGSAKLSDSPEQDMVKQYGVINSIKAASITDWDDTNQNYVYSSAFEGNSEGGTSLYDPLETLSSIHGEPDITWKTRRHTIYYYGSGLAVAVRDFNKDDTVIVPGKDGKLVTDIKIFAQLTSEQLLQEDGPSLGF